MSYIALYREFRPKRFSDIVGQQHISEILKNQIINDRIGHAYLFSGIRGTGKTTSAKVFARAINCLNPQDGEPCNECEICKGILDGSLTDVTEIDAASNNSVDNIRDIREEVMYLPTKAKYRVYIIDEVHMLSSGAFNALLKTLEEPPKHVKFILATTEPNKLPATILSRCQRFDFKRISNKDIMERLKYILNDIGKTAEDGALEIISYLSDGALRDAISILDRCTNDTDNITTEYVQELLGLPDEISILKILEDMVNSDAQEMTIKLEKLLKAGNNISNVLDQIIIKSRDLLIYLKTKQINTYNSKAKEYIENMSSKISANKLVNIISRMSEIQNNSKWSTNQEIVIEAGLIGICETTKYDDLEDIKFKLKALEEKINLGVITTKEVKKESTESIDKTKVDKHKEEKKDINEDTEKVEHNIDEHKKVENNVVSEGKDIEQWRDVLTLLREKGRVQIFTNLINAKAKLINDNIIGIYFKTEFTKNMIERADNIEIIKDVIEEIMKESFEIRCFLEKDKKENDVFSDIESKAKELNIPIDVVDE